VLKVIFVDEPSIATGVLLDRIRSDVVQRTTVAVLAAAVVFLGIMPDLLASRILAAVP
jgi:hypothetical protein